MNSNCIFCNMKATEKEWRKQNELQRVIKSHKTTYICTIFYQKIYDIQKPILRCHMKWGHFSKIRKFPLFQNLYTAYFFYFFLPSDLMDLWLSSMEWFSQSIWELISKELTHNSLHSHLHLFLSRILQLTSVFGGLTLPDNAARWKTSPLKWQLWKKPFCQYIDIDNILMPIP